MRKMPCIIRVLYRTRNSVKQVGYQVYHNIKGKQLSYPGCAIMGSTDIPPSCQWTLFSLPLFVGHDRTFAFGKHGPISLYLLTNTTSHHLITSRTPKIGLSLRLLELSPAARKRPGPVSRNLGLLCTVMRFYLPQRTVNTEVP